MTPRRRIALLALALAVGSPARAVPPDPSDGCFQDPGASRRIAEAIADLKKLAGDGSTITPYLKAQGMDAALATLKMAEDAVAAGRLLLAVEKVDQARGLLEPLRYMDPLMEKVKSGGDADLDAALKPLAAQLDALRPEIARPSEASLPAAVRALRDASRNQAPILEKTSPMWRETKDLVGSLYYEGDAVALARSAAFDASLTLDAPKPPPAFPPLGPILDRVERDLTAAYHEPASTERHRDFILASSAIKESRELLAAGLTEAAAHVYLRSRIYARSLIDPEAKAPAAADLETRLAALRERVASKTVDDTIGCLYWEKARANLDLAKASGKEDYLRAAAAIVGDVLPEYFRLAGEVTVTLVRWPYT